MIANGQSVPYVSHAPGISEALIYKWKQRTKGKEKQTIVGQGSEVFLENQHLQQRIQQLEIERDILKKALGVNSHQKVDRQLINVKRKICYQTDFYSM